MEFTQACHADLAALGVLPPDTEPHATVHIAPMIAIIEELIEAGKAYRAEGHVLDHIPAIPEYGKLSGANPDEMLAGAPVLAALNDDLNTPAALAALHAIAGQIHSETDPGRRAELAASLREAGALPGLRQQDAVAWAQAGAGEVSQIEAAVAERVQARANRDWARADALRDDLLALGVDVEDAGSERRWRVRT